MADPAGFTPDPPGFEPDPPTSLGQRASSGLKALHALVGRGLRSVDTLGGRMPGSPAGSFITPESVNPVPRNLTEAGAQAAQMAIPGGNALTRILGQAAGGEVGSRLEGGAPWQGALQAGGAAALGEGIGGVVGKAARSAPGAKGFIAAEDASGYLGEMGRQSPPLRGAKTVDDLQTLAAGRGLEKLGQAKERTVQRIEGMVPKMTAMQIPALGRTAQVQAPLGVGGTHTKTISTPMTLREANDALSEIGTKAFSKNPLERNFNGIDQRQLYGKVAGEIEAELTRLNPRAAALFRQTQDQYKSGLAFLRPAESERAYRIGPSGTQFNTPYFQQTVQSPKKMAAMGNKLGDADFNALRNILTRGAGQGKDVLASGEGNMLDALRQTIGRGTNSGAMGYLGVPLRTLAPNIGSQYAGRQPLSLPPALQQALDLVLQRQAGQMGGQP